jgi:sugar phosphate isomerase/epimerase
VLFGICTPSVNAPALQAAGWDFVEDNVQGLLQGLLPDDQWHAPAPAVLPVLAANVLVPGSLKITGPDVDPDRLKQYMATVTRRAGGVGIKTLVFGSGAARMVPPGFDRATAERQVVDFARMAAELAGTHGVTIVFEPLNRHECNIVNSVAEAAEFAARVDHPNCQVLVDTFHLWMEHEPVENVARAVSMIRHVHVADLDGRVAPSLSGKADYGPLFRILKAAGYDGTVSVESSPIPDFEVTAPKVLAFLKDQWATA